MKRILVGLIFTTILFLGCDDGSIGRREQMTELGLLKAHTLRQIEQGNISSGQIKGAFFLGIGRFDGSVAQERALQFYWGRTPEEIFATTLPYSAFKFIIDESQTTPTIEFIFDEHWLNNQDYIYTESQKVNLHRWINVENLESGVLRVAIVRISKSTLEKEIYLPK